MNSWIEISEQALVANYRALTRAARGQSASAPGGAETSVIAVVKADAYGHGLALCAPVLAAAGAPWLGVADAKEGTEARKAIGPGAQPQILLMSGLLPGDTEAIFEQRLTPAVWTPLQLEWLEAAARRNPPAEALAVHLEPAEALPVHLEIDTGMSRQGARPGREMAEFLDRIAVSEHLTLGGVFTHFASAEVAGSSQTESQQRLFEAALDQLRQHTIFFQRNTVRNHTKTSGKRLDPLWIHASNSSALDLSATTGWLNRLAASLNARPLARAGLALYGYTLPLEDAAEMSQLQSNLKPILTWKTRIVDLREAPTGTMVGYNGTYTTSAPTRIALLPVGYSDGLRRELSSTSAGPSGWTMVHGHRASILGRISMNLSNIDVTGIPCGIGDEVTLLGSGMTAADHGRLAGTIPYEILCGLRATPCLIP